MADYKIDEPQFFTAHAYNYTISVLKTRGIIGDNAKRYAISLLYSAQLQKISIQSLLETSIDLSPLFEDDSVTTYMINKQAPLENIPIVSYRKTNSMSYKAKDILL